MIVSATANQILNLKRFFERISERGYSSSIEHNFFFETFTRSPLRSAEGRARVVIKNHTGPSASRERLIALYRSILPLTVSRTDEPTTHAVKPNNKSYKLVAKVTMDANGRTLAVLCVLALHNIVGCGLGLYPQLARRASWLG